jgi:hypothetical protein
VSISNDKYNVYHSVLTCFTYCILSILSILWKKTNTCHVQIQAVEVTSFGVLDRIPKRNIFTASKIMSDLGTVRVRIKEKLNYYQNKSKVVNRHFSTQF